MNGQERHRVGSRVGAGVAAAALAAGATILVAAVASATASAAGALPPMANVPVAGPDAGVPAYIQSAAQGQVTPPDVEDVEHMCALLTSCDKLPFPPQMLPNNMSTCVSTLMGDLTSVGAVKYSLTIRECGLRANSCSELRACVLHGVKPDACAGRGTKSAIQICDQITGAALSCWHEQVVGVRDCQRGGEQCVVREGQAGCAIGPCTNENKEGSSATCSANGERILQCDHGKLGSLDCGAFGLKCTVENGRAGCAPPTAVCASTAKRCEGNVAVGCEHGHEVRIDCGAAGLTCNSSPGSSPVGACVSPAPAAGEKCDSKDSPKCDGATIRYCLAGRKRSYFCKSLGFNRCVKEGQTVHCDM